MRISVNWVLLVAALLFSTSCGSSDDLENPDPIYLVLDGSTSIHFEDDDQHPVDVLEATSADPNIVRIDGLEDGSANFTGLAEGDTNLELRTKSQRLTAKIHVRAPDRFELSIKSYPWPPCERFAPGGRETGIFEWFRKEQKLKGVRADTVFESSDTAVATVSYDSMEQATISYLKPGNVSVTAAGIEGPSRRVVALEDLVSLALWVDPGATLIDEGSKIAPLNRDFGPYTFLVNGRDGDGALVCPHGSPQELKVEPPADESCSFSSSCDYLCEFSLDRTSTGLCAVEVEFGSRTAVFDIPFNK